MIPLCTPNLSGNEAKYLAECIATTFVSSVGPFVTRFEEMVGESAGTAGAVATASGTTALHAALLSAGVRRDDLVICPSLTFIASANAISHCGAQPWLFEVTRESWTLDPAQLREAFSRSTVRRSGDVIHKDTGRRIAAFLPVFTLGTPADMDPILEVAREYRLPVVVDAAAGLGARYKGRPSGATGAELTMYSFNGNKTVTAGGGGCIVSNDLDLLKHFRHLTTTARVGSDYDHDMVGYNYRMTNLQAAVGCAQMEQLDRFVARKRQIAKLYDEAFASMAGSGSFPAPDWAQSPAWFSGLVFDGPLGVAHCSSLRQTLRDHGIDARPFWKPMHLQAPYQMVPRESLSFSSQLWERIVTLPCSTLLSEKDQHHVIDTVLAWDRHREAA